MNKYPMHEELQKVKDKSELCGDFLQWLRTKYSMIEKREGFEECYVPVGYSSYIDIEKILAEYFNIDLNEIEKEKREMIEELKTN